MDRSAPIPMTVLNIRHSRYACTDHCKQGVIHRTQVIGTSCRYLRRMRMSPMEPNMIRRCGFSTLLALSTAFAALPLQGQVGGAGSVVNGRVVVQVFVTLSDDATPYHPVSGLPLGFIRTPRDTSIAVTDRTGSAILL